jgi:ferredoxin-NADP reductase
VLAGPRAWFAGGDPFGPDALRAAVPDLTSRSVYVCGPPAMQSAAVRSLRAAGVSTSHVHLERFGV